MTLYFLSIYSCIIILLQLSVRHLYSHVDVMGCGHVTGLVQHLVWVCVLVREVRQ